MKRITGILLLLAALFLASCKGPASKAPSAPAKRAFPSVEIPAMFTSGEERFAFMGEHLWDRFTDTSAVYYCDSVTVNGVALEEVESQMGLFATLLKSIPRSSAKSCVARFFGRVEAFGRRYPESNMFSKMSELTNKYFYDPNSPVRDEDLYGVYVSRLAESDLLAEDYRPKYRYDAQMCARNPVGSVATDFPFTDIRGKVHTLHGIKAEYTLLIFGNPGCSACRDLMEEMESLPSVTEAISSGRLKVVDVFIDPEIDEWKAQAADFPANWICGYDHRLAISEERLYNVRGIPSLYLLDADKKVLLKDAPQENVLAFLERL